jgi:hypothetical protein
VRGFGLFIFDQSHPRHFAYFVNPPETLENVPFCRHFVRKRAILGADKNPAICNIFAIVPICRHFIKNAQFATMTHFNHFGVVYAHFDPI